MGASMYALYKTADSSALRWSMWSSSRKLAPVSDELPPVLLVLLQLELESSVSSLQQSSSSSSSSSLESSELSSSSAMLLFPSELSSSEDSSLIGDIMFEVPEAVTTAVVEVVVELADEESLVLIIEEECLGDWLCTSGGTKPSFTRFFCFIRRFWNQIFT
uniref:Uncharacterized protein n=1 Tax=Anopheles culicifacies TaxID=139723 RepID=A0A182MDA5_9DIPT